MLDMDLAQFFDRVNHTMLMARVARKAHDNRVLKLMCGDLHAGVMEDPICAPTEEGKKAYHKVGH